MNVCMYVHMCMHACSVDILGAMFPSCGACAAPSGGVSPLLSFLRGACGP